MPSATRHVGPHDGCDNPDLHEHPAAEPKDDKVLCPSCKEGEVWADFMISAEIGPNGKPPRATNGPDDDSFLSAVCSNVECDAMLRALPGDGRLRRAYLSTIHDDEPLDFLNLSPDDAVNATTALEAAWRAVVVELLERQG